MFSPESSARLSQKPPCSPPKKSPPYCSARNGFDSDLIKQYINGSVHVWMLHGNSFWICPVDSMGDVLFCYAWDGSDWKFIRINISGIDCFYQEGNRNAG
jgi:hypothetical protein